MRKIICAVLIALPLMTFAGKEKGGGNFERLMQHTGLRVRGPSTHVSDFNYGTRRMFLGYMRDFLKTLKRDVLNGQTSYTDSMGLKAEVTVDKILELERIYQTLEKNEEAMEEGEIESIDTGERMIAVNFPDQVKLLVDYDEFYSKIAGIRHPELKQRFSSAFAGHELLSLAKIENDGNYAVSATYARGPVLEEFNLVCLEYLTKAQIKRKVAPHRIDIAYSDKEKVMRLTPKNFEWPGGLGGGSSPLDFDVSSDPLHVDLRRGFASGYQAFSPKGQPHKASAGFFLTHGFAEGSLQIEGIEEIVGRYVTPQSILMSCKRE